MKSRRLRNVTITVDEEVARWARVRAAEENSSISKLIGGMLCERMLDSKAYERAMKRYLVRKRFLRVGSHRPTRDELHDRTALR